MTQNGNQELVYRAIEIGADMIGEIAATTGLDNATVITHVMRLCDTGRVRRRNTSPQSYEIARKPFLLAEYWRKAA